MKFLKKLSLTSILGLLYALPVFAKYGLEETGEAAGLSKIWSGQELPQIIGSVIKIGLSMIGVIFMILILYGGYLWMTAYGSTEKVSKAKDTITNAAIGLIIVLAAYAITSFVVSALVGTPAATPSP